MNPTNRYCYFFEFEFTLDYANFCLLCKVKLKKTMIEVCCAIILKESKMLAVQRGPKSNHPLQWEFPGGKKDPNETAAQCIVREIEEELTLRIAASHQLESIEFTYGEKHICLIPFVCQILSGEIHLTEHVDQRWVALNEWEAMDWLDADRKLILKNIEQLKWLLP